MPMVHVLVVSFVLCLTSAMVRSASAAPGQLDPTFGSGGRVVTSFGSGITASAGALQPNGRIVVAGGVNDGAAKVHVTRYDTSGALDPSFGSGGIATITFGTFFVGLFAVAVQPDLKIVAAGQRDSQFLVIRYLSNGTLDPAFGAGGIVVTPIGFTAFAWGLALQGDGKIVVAGEADVSGASFDFALARYDDAGNLDPSFGSGGIVTTTFGCCQSSARAVAIQADGRIVAAGGSNQRFAVARYDASGALEMTATTEINGDAQAEAMLVQSDGHIVLAGSEYDTGVANKREIALARYAADLTLEGGFGAGGIVKASLGPFLDRAWAVVGSGDDIVMGGETDNAGRGFVLRKYKPDGSLVTSFGAGGTVVTAMSTGRSVVNELLRQPDDKLVAVGSTCHTETRCDGSICQTGTFCDIALARYLDDKCGNGVMDAGEECDDGNGIAGDCCSPSCLFEPVDTPCTDDGSTCTTDLCDGTAACAHAVRIPPGCTPAAPGGSRLKIVDKANDARDAVQWKWVSGAPVDPADLGDPLTITGYTMCVVDDVAGTPSLRLSLSAPPAGTCGPRRCWKIGSAGPIYKDKALTPDGVASMKLAAGAAGEAKIGTSGRGMNLAVTALPARTPVSVFLMRDDGLPHCWQASFSTPKVNEPGSFRATSD